MALTFALYNDAALTSPVTGNLVFQQLVDASTGRADRNVFLGSVQAARTLKATSNPGVDQIVLSVADATPGSGHPASEVKLALTQGGLAGAVGGAALNLGTVINSGVGNALSIWIGVTDSTHVVGTSTELSVATNSVTEQ